MENITVDIGTNVSNMITELAKQIGVTADKVFPWYVSQSLIDGWVSVLVLLLITTSCLITIYRAKDKADFNGTGNVQSWVIIISGAILVVFAMLTLIGGSYVISEIINPEYRAVKMMMIDLSRLK